MIHHVLSVTGMTCDHCASTIEKTLRDLGGVQTVKVSYAEGKAWVETQDTVQVEGIVAAIKASGYGATVLANETAAMVPSSNLRVAIIGSGATAFAAAIRAAEGGAQVTLIERGVTGRHLRERGVCALQDHDPRRAYRAPARQQRVRCRG